MKTYLVCDQDGFICEMQEGDVPHYLSNPTHTSHIGVGGDDCLPVPYSNGSSAIPEYTTDPVSPVAGQVWLKANGSVGVAGQAMGVMGLTYTQKVIAGYDLCIKTEESKIVRVRME